MCGIIGVIGPHQAAPILTDGLRRLEYRGYDSAGIATVDASGTLGRRRAVGKLAELADLLVHEPLAGRIGIGHTRWATHGAPTQANAHPHRAGPVAVVHNGIVENHAELRAELLAQGANFEGETDTEVVAALVAALMRGGLGPVEAALAATDRLRGAFALAFLFEGEDDLIVGARKGSPLVVGRGEGATYLGSDATALGPLTDRITYLEEGDRAVLRRGGATVFDASGAEVQRAETRVPAADMRLDKAGHRHFMAKEIHEQPAVLQALLAHHLGAPGLGLPEGLLEGVERVVIVACGTAYIAGLVAKHWLERIAGLPVEVDVASEYRYRAPLVGPGTLGIAVSQSGETADTRAALDYLRPRALRTLAMVNVTTSTMAREADLVLPIRAGAEISVASTKAFTCQLAAFAVIALEAARRAGTDVSEHVAALGDLPRLVDAAIGASAAVAADLGEDLKPARHALFLGRGPMHALALEGALKLKEISYVHAEGYPAGELKHGPIALVDPAVPVIVMAPRDALFEKTVSNMAEVMARGGPVVLVSDEEGIARAGAEAWRTLALPRAHEFLAPILYAVPAQLIAYHAAVARGTDVDQPRNLAKSVTVE